MMKYNMCIVGVLASDSFLSREIEAAKLFPNASPLSSPRVSSTPPLVWSSTYRLFFHAMGFDSQSKEAGKVSCRAHV